MILIECEQGSQEWLQARAGVITGSEFRTACDRLRNGNRSTGSIRYAAEVAIERISGEPFGERFQTWAMRRGKEMEPIARMEYESRTGYVASESGIVLSDDRKFGYSTDGLVDDIGLIEIKCLLDPERLIAIWRDHDLSDYMHQMQGGLWLTGRKWVDFVMYAPQLAPVGKQLYHRRIMRDEKFILLLERELQEFAALVEENELTLRMKETA